MMSESTPRHALPLLAPGQAQKELSHNEALAVVDLLIHAQVEAVGTNSPPPTPAAGQCWIVGPVPTGAWAGRPGVVAGWTPGGWRFAAPREGMSVALAGDAGFARYAAGQWTVGAMTGTAVRIGGAQVVGARRPPIADPTGGTTVDSQARTAISAVLDALRAHGLIAG